MQPKYFNTMRAYLPMLQQCVTEKMWIHTNRHWYGPYDWAMQYGVSHFGLEWEPKLADPYLLISQATSKELTESQAASIEKFEKRVDAYYISEKDALLLKSIETGRWHYPL